VYRDVVILFGNGIYCLAKEILTAEGGTVACYELILEIVFM
jgi:hypothetical protein